MFVRFIPCNYKQTSKAFFFPLVFFFSQEELSYCGVYNAFAWLLIQYCIDFSFI